MVTDQITKIQIETFPRNRMQKTKYAICVE